MAPDTSTATDADGLAAWKGYMHGVGVQRVRAQATGLPPVDFTATVTARGARFDGVYFIFSGESGLPLLGIEQFIQIDNGQASAGFQGPYDFALDESTGALTFRWRAGLTSSYFFTGSLSLDGEDRAVGSGVRKRDLDPAGTWVMQRQ